MSAQEILPSEDILIVNFINQRAIDKSKKNPNTIKQYRIVMESFWKEQATIKGKKIYELSKTDLKSIIRELSQTNDTEDSYEEGKKSVTTLKNYFYILSSYLRFINDEYEDEGIKIENNVSRIKFPKEEERSPIYLEINEIKEIIENLIQKENKESWEYYQTILLFLYPISVSTRVSETSNTLIKDIDKQNSRIKIIGKGNKERINFLPTYNDLFTYVLGCHLENRKKRIEELIKSYKTRLTRNQDSKKTIERKIKLLETNDFLFINRNGNKLTPRSIQRLFKKLREKYHFKKKITPHKLRHTFATILVTKGFDAIVIKDLMGHSNIATTLKYAHVVKKAVKEKLNEIQPFGFNVDNLPYNNDE